MTPVDFDLLVSLIRRYDKPGPRYTSYPTAVEFSDRFDEAAYRTQLAGMAATTTPISLYLHLPFCEERCSFCGCSVIITRKREIAAGYLTYLHRELAMLGEALGTRRQVVQYHWGAARPPIYRLRKSKRCRPSSFATSTSRQAPKSRSRWIRASLPSSS